MVTPMKYLLLVVALLLPAACQLPTNVALQKIDQLRMQQNACLNENVSQFEDGTSEAGKVGYYVAMSCTVQTDKLVQYAVPYATPAERQAFQRDAALRATGNVLRARAQPRS